MKFFKFYIKKQRPLPDVEGGLEREQQHEKSLLS